MAILNDISVTIQIITVDPNEKQKGVMPGETYPAIAKEYNGDPFWKVSFILNGTPCHAWAVPEDMKTSHLTTCVIVQPKENDIVVIDPQIIN